MYQKGLLLLFKQENVQFTTHPFPYVNVYSILHIQGISYVCCLTTFMYMFVKLSEMESKNPLVQSFIKEMVIFCVAQLISSKATMICSGGIEILSLLVVHQSHAYAHSHTACACACVTIPQNPLIEFNFQVSLNVLQIGLDVWVYRRLCSVVVNTHFM